MLHVYRAPGLFHFRSSSPEPPSSPQQLMLLHTAVECQMVPPADSCRPRPERMRPPPAREALRGMAGGAASCGPCSRVAMVHVTPGPCQSRRGATRDESRRKMSQWRKWDAHLPRTARTIFELPGADGLREQSEESDAPHFVLSMRGVGGRLPKGGACLGVINTDGTSG